MATFRGFELRFHPRETHYPTDFDTGLDRFRPCYSFDGQTTYHGTVYAHKMYRWYYKMNNGIGCCFQFPNAKSMGNHTHDFETITILYNKANDPVHVYFHAHGRGQGVWRPWDECEKTSQGQLVVYVARFSHAAYPTAGLFPRIFGFGSDMTSSKGMRIIYDRFIHLDSQMVTLSDGKVVKLANVAPLPAGSITPLLRFALPFTKNIIRAL